MLRHQPAFVVVIGFALSTVAASYAADVAAAPPSSSAAPATARLTALPLADRISLLFELPETGAAAARASDVSSDKNAFEIDVGPVATAIAPVDRTADASVPFVSRVSLRSSSNASGQTFARIRVELRARCQHSVRLSNRRLYIDVVPTAGVDPLSARTSTQSNSPQEGGTQQPPRAREPERDRTVRPEVTAPPAVANSNTSSQVPRSISRGSVASGAASSRPIDQGPEMSYEALQAEARRRAPLLAGKPDVNGLIALIAEIRRRDERLGKKRPDLIEPLIDEMNQALDEARGLRLKLDAIELKKKQEEKR
jgi:hypothetical protein